MRSLLGRRSEGRLYAVDDIVDENGRSKYDTVEELFAAVPESYELHKDRITILPDKRLLIQFGGIFEHLVTEEDIDAMEQAFIDIRREREAKFDEEWPPLSEP